MIRAVLPVFLLGGCVGLTACSTDASTSSTHPGASSKDAGNARLDAGSGQLDADAAPTVPGSKPGSDGPGVAPAKPAPAKPAPTDPSSVTDAAAHEPAPALSDSDAASPNLQQPDAGPLEDATVPFTSSTQDGGGPTQPEWSDVVPTRMRLGPQTAPRELFKSEYQLGAYWETPSGDVLTGFRTSVTQPEEGIATYDYNYTLQTIVDGQIQPTPELELGSCRYQDWPYGSCSVGLDPSGPSPRSLVANDGSILVVTEKPISLDMMYPQIELIDPGTGATSPILELTDLEMPRSSAAFTVNFRLLQLADDTIALAAETRDVPARTVVFTPDGTRLADRDGFAFGERWQRFAVFLGENSGAYNQRFDWWDPRTGAAARAFGFPEETPSPAFRTFVTPVGDVIFPGSTYTDRLIRIDPDGAVVEDKELPAWGFLASLPDGRYLTLENDETLGYVIKVYDRQGQGTVIYDQATLLQDASWPKLKTSVNGTFPFIAPLEFGAIVDDGGNAYVGFVLQTDGEVSRTHIGAFAPDGHKLWGWNLDSTTPGTCLPESILSGHRLVARCFGRYLRRFVILGE